MHPLHHLDLNHDRARSLQRAAHERRLLAEAARRPSNQAHLSHLREVLGMRLVRAGLQMAGSGETTPSCGLACRRSSRGSPLGHHNGSNTTVFRMVSGSLRLEYGDPPRSTEAGPRDFVVVPPHTSHREIVTGVEQVEAVAVRFIDGEGPLTVELDGLS